MLRIFLSLLGVLAFTGIQYAVANSVAVATTRVIYDGNKKEASTSVRSSLQSPVYLIQTWIDDQHEKSNTPFLATPPLARLEPGRENLIRIVRIGDLPDDRESVYWLNVKAIPPKPIEQGEANNVLQIAIKTRLKLFYRPPGLEGSSQDAPKTLVWSGRGNTLTINNPSAFSVSVSTTKIDGNTINNVDLIPAKKSVSVKVPIALSGNQDIRFKVINDYGAESIEYRASLRQL